MPRALALGPFQEWSKADMTTRPHEVRFTPESGHSALRLECPLSANSVYIRGGSTQAKRTCSAAGSLPQSRQLLSAPRKAQRIVRYRFASVRWRTVEIEVANHVVAVTPVELLVSFK